MKPRDVHDLDFAMGEWPTDAELTTEAGNRPSQTWGVGMSEYEHYGFTDPHYHCLFNVKDFKPGGEYEGIRIQDPEQIKYFKRKWGRDKDKEDLKA